MPRFQIRSVLGQGGMGTVYRAYDALQDMEVALKTSSASDPADLARLRDEYRIVRRISHPNLTPPWELFDGVDATALVEPHVPTPFFIMPILPGGPIDTAFDALPDAAARLARVRDLLPGLLNGLATLHAHGIVHGDVKPSNLFVDGRDLWWFDFGLSSRSDTPDPVAGGAVAFMAPEVLLGGRSDVRTDVYGLGVLLFQLITGALPFDPHGAIAWRQKQEGGFLRLRALLPGVAPEIDAIVDAMMAPHPDTRPDLDAIAAAFGVPPVAPSRPPPEAFIGRDPQLALLTRALDDARAGQPRLVRVHGPSGIGKSALIKRFTDQRTTDAMVLWGACDPRAAVTYDALAMAMDALTHRLAAEGSIGESLSPTDLVAASELFPTLRQIGFLDGGRPEGSPDERRVRAITALRRVLRQVSEATTLVFVLDDFQWAADDTRRLLHDLCAHADAPRALWVLGERDQGEATPRWIPPEDLHALDCPVHPLTDDEIARVWAGLGGRTDVTQGVVTAAAGNPYVVRFLREHLTDAPLGADSGDVASMFARTVEEALRDLSPEARRVVELSSVADSALVRSALLAAAGIGPAMRPMLANLEDHAWLATLDTIADLVAPYHGRIAEVVAATLPHDTTVGRHRSLYEVLTRWGATDIRLYPHARGAGLLAEAGRHARGAADASMARLAFGDAAIWYGHAAELAAPDVLCGLHERRAYALACSGRLRDAATAYMDAAHASTETTPAGRRLAIRMRTRSAENLLRSGAIAEGKRLFDEIFEAIGEPMPRTERAAQLEGARHRLMMLFSWKTTRVATTIPDDLQLRIDTLQATSLALSSQFAAEGDALILRMLRLALRHGIAESIVKGYAQQISVDTALGVSFLVKRAERMLDEMRRLAGEDPGMLARAMGAESTLAWSRGQWTRTVACADVCEATFPRAVEDSRFEMGISRTFRFSALWCAGRIQELQRSTSGLLEEAYALDDILHANTLRLGECSSLDLVRDAPQTVLSHADIALGDWAPDAPSTQRYLRLHGVLRAHLYLGDPAAGWREIEREWPVLKSGMYLALVPTACFMLYGRASTAIALAAASEGRERTRWLQEANTAIATLRRGTSFLPSGPIAALLSAGVAGVEGRPDAPDALRHAADLLDAVDMPMHAAAARAVHPDAQVAAAGADHLRALAVVDVPRFARCLAPGWT